MEMQSVQVGGRLCALLSEVVFGSAEVEEFVWDGTYYTTISPKSSSVYYIVSVHTENHRDWTADIMVEDTVKFTETFEDEAEAWRALETVLLCLRHNLEE